MINSELGHCESIEEFNSEIRRQQEGAHGKGYCSLHDAIRKYLKKSDTYMEFGVHQGGTASAAMLAKPRKIILVDVDFTKYNMFLRPLAHKYCEENNIELVLKQASSIELGSLNNCDMLNIDSVHSQRHMTQELALHGNNINTYLLAHDTKQLYGKDDDRLHRTLMDFAKTNKWDLIERGEQSVGYTVLKKSNG